MLRPFWYPHNWSRNYDPKVIIHELESGQIPGMKHSSGVKHSSSGMKHSSGIKHSSEGSTGPGVLMNLRF